MIELVNGRTLRYELNGERTHDRCVGVCYLEGVDISAEMVRLGVARDCPRFSGGRYRMIEAQAAADGATVGRTYRLPGILPTLTTTVARPELPSAGSAATAQRRSPTARHLRSDEYDAACSIGKLRYGSGKAGRARGGFTAARRFS
jgi:hypothetical protein